MDFERLLLTDSSELFKFSIDFEDVAYLLLIDTFSKAPKGFGEKIMDDDFVPNSNHIIVKCGLRRELSAEERDFILSFAESILSFKPSIDYMIDFFYVDTELESDYPEEQGVLDLVDVVNKVFKSDIVIKNASSMNNIMQK
ncbi:hypothetical protein [Listeria cornellensis]|uniref:Uncharacterized protein n=1 Tax=Listeria cornellensis FSL F6-0969 TaxID=1265820 RepID=W7BXW9_9LIST|nr:hypothetical protein [Listeria cornellensis]EUJ25198.1 hypothetical protein PCORN_18419 [Listeria cornellensis FSL F6-0969]